MQVETRGTTRALQQETPPPASSIARVLFLSKPAIMEMSNVGTTATASVQLTNKSDEAIPVIGLPTTSAQRLSSPWSTPKAFEAGSSCKTSLAARASCELTVALSPATPGMYLSTLNVEYASGKDGTRTASTNLVGVVGMTSMTLNGGSTILNANSTFQVSVLANFSDNSTADASSMATYSSSNEAIASVNQNGVVTVGNSSGVVVIKAVMGSSSSQTTFTVVNNTGFTKRLGQDGSDGYVGTIGRDGRGITRDAQNNIYTVTKSNHGGSGGFSILTKFNASGTQIWKKTIGAIGYKTASVENVAVDAAGNIFVLGFSNISFDDQTKIGNQDVFVQKYNSSGVRLWTRLYGYASGTVWPYDVVADSTGSIYLTGQTSGGLNGNSQVGTSDFFLIKVSGAGVLQWTKQLGFATKTTMGLGVAVDSDDNVYATGTNTGSFDGHAMVGSTDTFVIKYDDAGTKLWSQTFGVASQTVGAKDIKINSDDEVVVTGYTTGGLGGNSQTGGWDLFLMKLDSAGASQWVVQDGIASTYVKGVAIAIDQDDGIYLAGTTQGGLHGNTLTGTEDLFLAKYNNAGVRQWTSQLGPAATALTVNGLAVDGNKNSYITGRTPGDLDGQTKSGTNDAYVTKFNSSGIKQWTKLDGTRQKIVIAKATSLDASGNLYVAGTATGDLEGQTRIGTQDVFVIKYNSSGAKIWATFIGVNGAKAAVEDIGTDALGNLYVTGSTTGALHGETFAGQEDLYLTKINSAGVRQWTRLMGVAGGSSASRGIAFDSSNNVYITGNTYVGLDGNTLTGTFDLFVVKYNGTGVKQWTKQMGVATKMTSGTGLTLDSDDNLYVCGYTGGTLDGQAVTGTRDIVLIKYDNSGTKQWTRLFGVASADSMCSGIAVDSQDDIYLAGDTKGSLDGITKTGTQDAVLAKYTSAGNRQWTKLLGTAGLMTVGNDLAVTASDKILITGVTEGALPGTTLVGYRDMFVGQYDTSGNRTWLKQVGATSGPAYLNIFDIATDTTGNAYIAGSLVGGGYEPSLFAGTTDVGLVDGILVKFDNDGNQL